MSIIGILAGAGIKLAKPIASALGEAVVKKVAEDVVGQRVGNALDKSITAIMQAWKNGYGSSLVSATQSVRVEPYVVVDARCARLPYAKDVMVLGQKLYSAYYLLANAAENSISGVKLGKRLDNFATDRDLRSASLSFLGMESAEPSLLSIESYQFGLPFVGAANGLKRWDEYSPEASTPVKPPKEDPSGNKSPGTTIKAAAVINDVGNLAVGQMLDVTISDGKQTGTIPVMVKLRPIGMAPHAIAAMMTASSVDERNDERWMKFRLGDITSFTDLITKQDQVRRYRQALLADRSGYLRKAMSRDNKALLAGALTGTASIGSAASMMIVHRDTIRDAEHEMDYNLDDFKTRQAIFDRGMLMLMFVVDDGAETVTVYTRDIDDYATYTLRDLKSSAGSNNTDLAEIMKTYLEGRIPGRL